MINNFLKIGLGFTLISLGACSTDTTNLSKIDTHSEAVPTLAKVSVGSDAFDDADPKDTQETFAHRVPSYCKQGSFCVLSGMMTIKAWKKNPKVLGSLPEKLMTSAITSLGVNAQAFLNGNGVQAFRKLEIGQDLYFPPVDKSGKAGSKDDSKLPLSKKLARIEADFDKNLFNEDGTLHAENNLAILIRLQKRPDLLTAEWEALIDQVIEILYENSDEIKKSEVLKDSDSKIADTKI